MKSKFFLILLSVSIATAALGVAQVGAYEPPPSKTETPAATEPTNRNQSALEVDIEEYKARNVISPCIYVMSNGNSKRSVARDSYGETWRIYDKDGNFVKDEVEPFSDSGDINPPRPTKNKALLR